MRIRIKIATGVAPLALLPFLLLGCSSSDGTADQGGTSVSAGADAGADAGDAASGGQAFADLRADVNRNGTVDLDDPTEDANEDTWDSSHGAIFLANIDDDLHACPIKDSAGNMLSDDDLAKCNDAADEVVNGDDDLLDMARLRTVPWAAAPDDASAHIALSSPGADYVRLFIHRGDGFEVFTADSTMTAAELRAGVELAIEGKDIVRDTSVWDGYVDVTLQVHGGTGASGPLTDASDMVRMRIAPVMLSHHLQPVDTLYASKLPGDSDSAAYLAALGDAATAAGVPNPLDSFVPREDDQWTQDYFETGAMTMPAPNGGQHVITVYIRSANIESSSTTTPLRQAGRVVFEQFRGPDAAGIQEYDPTHSLDMDSLNSFGNTETIPPYELNGVSYPLGRIIRGSTPTFYPDPLMNKLLQSQAVQPMVNIDTSWLLVGHVDETLSFVKAASPRGWALVANDPALARQMLQDASDQGQGSTPMFTGMKWLDDNGNEIPADTTIDQVLADTDVMSTSAQASVSIEAELGTLRTEVGLTDDEIIRVPFLHESVYGYSIAYQPGTVNGVFLSNTDFAAPEPHGPVINGVDIFKKQMQDAFAPYGITVHFIEDWNLYHRLEGEVHCGSNAKRTLPTNVRWWETGR